MKPTTVIFLGVLLLACIALVVVRNVDWNKSEDTKIVVGRKLVFSAAPANPVSLDVIAVDGDTLSFVKEGDSWRIIEPIRAKAVGYKVEEVTGALKDLKYERVFSRDEEDAPAAGQTGLDKPLWTLVLIDGENKRFTLLVGKSVPLSGGEKTYVRPAGSPLTYVVAKDFAAHLSRPMREYREKKLLDIDANKVIRVKIDGYEKIELLKGMNDKWGLISPNARADGKKVDKLLRSVLDLKAEEFITDKPGKLSLYGLDKPLLTIDLWLQPAPAPSAAASMPIKEERTNFSLLLGGRASGTDSVFAKIAHQPTVFTVKRSVMDRLQPRTIDLRDRHVVRFEQSNVNRIEIEIGDRRANLVKKDGRWRMLSPQKGAANEPAVLSLLRKISNLKAANFRDDALAAKVYRLDEPRGKITLHELGRNRPLTLLIGASSLKGEMVGLRTTTDKAVAVAAVSDVKDLLADPVTYWDATILKLDADAKIAAMTLSRPDNTFSLARKDDKWTLSSPLVAAADSEAADRIADMLRGLLANKIVYLGPKVPDKYARSPALIEIAMTVQTPRQRPQTTPATTSAPRAKIDTYKILIAKFGDKSYCWIPGGRTVAVGEFSSDLYQTLIAELRNRKVLSFDPENIESFRIVSGKDTFEIRRREQGEWRCAGEPDVAIDPEKVADYLKGLTRTTARRFVSHDDDDAKAKKYAFDKPMFLIELTSKSGETLRLVVSHEPAKEMENRYAVSSGAAGVFMLPASAIPELSRTLGDFKVR